MPKLIPPLDYRMDPASLGRPNDDATLRLYTEEECAVLGGTWNPNGECLRPEGSSFSYDFRPQPIPVTLDTPLAYVEAEDVYISYTEWYGDTTIYGRRNLQYPDGSPVKGSGKSRQELVEQGVVASAFHHGATNGWPTPLPVEGPVVPVPFPEPPQPSQPPLKTVTLKLKDFSVTYTNVLSVDTADQA
jgi:hypothetical protein